MNINKSRLKLLQLLKFFGIFLSAYILGCYTIKKELFPYNIYIDWKYSDHIQKLPPQKLKFFGQIPGYGIGFQSKPEFIDLDSNLSVIDLNRGGHVIVIRHTLRDNKEGPDLWSMDRNGMPGKGASLNAKGIKDAKMINDVINKLRIPIGEVYSSPSHRTTQVAEIAFGAKNYTKKIELIYQPMMTFEEKSFYDTELIKLISEPIKDGKNRVLSAHNNTLERLGIEGLPSEKLEQGDAAIILPLGNLAFKYIGTIKIEEWSKYL